MNAFAASTDILFTDPHLSQAAIYRAGGTGAEVPVRVVRRAPDRLASFGEGRFVTDSVLIDVRTSDIAELAEGDTFEIDGALYEVRGAPVRDGRHLTWAAEARQL
ncbi:MAG: hypothetical protein HLUCCA12_12155 [Rhodobacteraceae bacterium HLUCCA12]|nr:MAG: hypothetical protein HLUCCA12_12155 [Rhodobacteraceae bacterium HLUCCA12]